MLLRSKLLEVSPLLFGGRACCDYIAADTWILDGYSWTEQFPSQKPSARREHALTFDAARGKAVLYGGDDSAPLIRADTWTFDTSGFPN